VKGAKGYSRGRQAGREPGGGPHVGAGAGATDGAHFVSVGALARGTTPPPPPGKLSPENVGRSRTPDNVPYLT